MLSLLLLVKRIAILLPGITVAYASERIIYPYFHQSLPVAPAILVTYIAGAYIFVPGIMRLWMLIIPPKHLPIYTVTPDGLASDPLNIGIIATRKQLMRVMVSAGWSAAKPSTPQTIIATVCAILLNRPFNGMPMSRLYLNGRKQDIGFEMQDPERGRGYRHHVRFWATTLEDLRPESTLTSPKDRSHDDRLLWAGAASLDTGISIVRHTFQLSHAVHPDTNQERDFIAKQLVTFGPARVIETVHLHRAYSLINRVWFTVLKTDGKMVILRLGS